VTLRVLMFGATGQVAREVRRRAGPELQVRALDRSAADLADPNACAALVADADVDVVINAAAYTAVDRAEDEIALAEQVNGVAPGAMAQAAAARNLPFLHVSTDYVFAGDADRPWCEDDPTGPINAYGRSKRTGEIAVAAAGGPHAVLRTAWVFSAHGANFLRTMLRLAAARDALSVVDDQIGDPTPAAAIADALITVAHAFNEGRGVSGVFHFSGGPGVSWRLFAEEIFRQASARGMIARVPKVTPIPSAAWPTPAARPRNSRLNCGRIASSYGIDKPDWRNAVDAVLADLAGAGPEA